TSVRSVASRTETKQANVWIGSRSRRHSVQPRLHLIAVRWRAAKLVIGDTSDDAHRGESPMLDRLEGSTGPLSPTEKVIRRLAQQINERPRLKALAQAFNEGPSRWLIELLSRSRIHLVGLERLAAL